MGIEALPPPEWPARGSSRQEVGAALLSLLPLLLPLNTLRAPVPKSDALSAPPPTAAGGGHCCSMVHSSAGRQAVLGRCGSSARTAAHAMVLPLFAALVHAA